MRDYCINHPGKEAEFYCSKRRRHLCRQCLACQDPTLYCKFRTSCIIWELVRHGEGQEETSPPAAQP